MFRTFAVLYFAAQIGETPMNTVRFQIEKYASVKEIQEKFSGFYPYLQVNFFMNRDGRKINSQTVVYSPEVKMMDINSNLIGGEFNLRDEMTVSELEKLLFDQFGLSVQVSGRSGNIWLKTNMTNNWALKEQNEHGRVISNDTPFTTAFRNVPFGC